MDVKNKYFPVLDKGFVCLKDVMGGDESIVQAARTSYGKGTKSVSDDRTLIRYLMRHEHTSVFEMVEFKFHIAMPIHVQRQFIRTRTANVNEYSGRYSEIPEVLYENYEFVTQSKNNKQGRTEDKIENSTSWKEKIKKHQEESFDIYQSLLREGVAREVARMHLPLNTYTYFYWKIDLHNLLRFLKLRCDLHAQKEIRDYAYTIAGIVKEVCPVAFEAWYDYSFAASNWTRLDKQLLNKLDNLKMTYNYNEFQLDSFCDVESVKEYAENIGMSKRELQEFWDKLEIPALTDFTLKNEGKSEEELLKEKETI